MSLLSSIFGADKLQAEGDALDARLAELNKTVYLDKYNRPDLYEQAQANAARGATGNVAQQIDAAFREGLQDGANNVTGFFGGAFDIVGKGVGAILKAVPWWIWAAAILYLLITTGLLGPLVRKATGK